MTPPIFSVRQGAETYPPFLSSIPEPPETLYYRGALGASAPAVAIVGTRRASGQGLEFTRALAHGFAARGVRVISGLAFGIDAAAHRGALEAGGVTWAVLAQGLHGVYPHNHARLAEEILDHGGAVLSEYEAGVPPLPHRFLARNRIIAGLAVATILVEVPIRSGALVTARHALDAGREVLVVPGPATHPNYRGSHFLLRNGARLASSFEEAWEDVCATLSRYPEYASFAEAQTADALPLPHGFPPDHARVFSAIKNAPSPATLDMLVAATTLEPHVVSQALTMLALAGMARERNGMFFA